MLPSGKEILAQVYHPKACKMLAELHFAWWERRAGV